VAACFDSRSVEQSDEAEDEEDMAETVIISMEVLTKSTVRRTTMRLNPRTMRNAL
jgi:hypothetical protein